MMNAPWSTFTRCVCNALQHLRIINYIARNLVKPTLVHLILSVYRRNPPPSGAEVKKE
jgi:hypothetical protein